MQWWFAITAFGVACFAIGMIAATWFRAWLNDVPGDDLEADHDEEEIAELMSRR